VTRPVAGAPSDNTSLVAVLAGLRQAGYEADLDVADDGRLCCRACDHRAVPDEVRLDELRRLEGASDPADMMAVLAVRCPSCGARGTAVVRYGPEAEPGHAELLRHLERGRR
jgi:hypothetical protein